MPIIYHVTTEVEWKDARERGFYEAPSLKSEGFIHCSEDRQVDGVVERYFGGLMGLVKLVIDTDKLTARYVTEYSKSVQDHFPHIYGPINLDAVTDVVLVR